MEMNGYTTPVEHPTWSIPEGKSVTVLD